DQKLKSFLDSGTINCDPTDDFSSLWHKVFRELQVKMQGHQPPGLTAQATTETVALDEFLNKKVAPDDIRYVLTRVPQSIVIIIDEIDRIEDGQATTLLADTIKTLSDHSVDATLVLVGVADSVDELISEHR